MKDRMSLRLRISLLSTLLFIVVLGAGSVYAIYSARRAVELETESVVGLTADLLEASVTALEESKDPYLRNLLLYELTRVETSRHLQFIVNLSASGGPVLPSGPRLNMEAAAPDWFVNLVRPPGMDFERVITSTGVQGTEIIIRADPAAEIVEAWYDARNFLLLLVIFSALSNLLIFFVLGRNFAPVEAILSGLERIEKGDYKLRLPTFSSMEFSRISERFNHMAAVLLSSREENRLLARHSLEIQEKERRRLAQELHDELGQSLSAIKAVATSMERGGADNEQAVVESATIISNISEDMYGTARAMIRQLRPAALDELGLALALEQLVDDWNYAHANTFCHLDISGNWNRLTDVAKINVYRIVQESLTNVARHARAREVYVTLKKERREGFCLTLEIKDDGVGFDPRKTRKSLGLLGIEERVDSMNGMLELDTAVQKGMTLFIILPMQHIESGGK